MELRGEEPLLFEAMSFAKFFSQVFLACWERGLAGSGRARSGLI